MQKKSAIANTITTTSSNKEFDFKQEAIKQWTHDPCGLLGAKGFEIGTGEFYERVDHNRYVEYAPWMKSVMPFADFQSRKVLEIGFGMGTDLFQFARGGAEVYGVDLSPEHLRIASERFAFFGLPANLQLADAENLPFPDASFDAVYSFGVIHHIPNIEQAVREIYRVLRPGGQAIISVYHKNSAFYYFCVLGGYLVHFRFLNESFQANLSRIEYREHSDACPLVKLLSRNELQDLFSQFPKVGIECHHLAATHFGSLQRLVPESLVRRVENKLGWYLVAKATK